MKTIDMMEIIEESYTVSDKIVNSEVVSRYLQRRRQMEEDESAQKLIREFSQIKELYEETKRFGHLHPDYHKALREARAFQRDMRQHPTIKAYMQAERELDELLFHVSKTIAHAVSPTVKIPANDPRLERQAVAKGSSCG